MPAQPEILQKISNVTICSWYYYLFLINSALSALLLLMLILTYMFNRKFFTKFIGGSFFAWLISTLIALTSSLFLYLLCDRALLSKTA